MGNVTILCSYGKAFIKFHKKQETERNESIKSLCKFKDYLVMDTGAGFDNG